MTPTFCLYHLQPPDTMGNVICNVTVAQLDVRHSMQPQCATVQNIDKAWTQAWTRSKDLRFVNNKCLWPYLGYESGEEPGPVDLMMSTHENSSLLSKERQWNPC